MISQLNSLFESEFSSDSEFSKSIIPSNVAIAAAVTSYARIEMIKYKINYDIYYTDTDSIFTSDDLTNLELGNEIGLMKDELKGNKINEAYFLGIKQYGYKYFDNNKLIEKSVFAGVSRDSLTFNDVKNIFNGKVLEINNNKRLII